MEPQAAVARLTLASAVVMPVGAKRPKQCPFLAGRATFPVLFRLCSRLSQTSHNHLSNLPLNFLLSPSSPSIQPLPNPPFFLPTTNSSFHPCATPSQSISLCASHRKLDFVTHVNRCASLPSPFERKLEEKKKKRQHNGPGQPSPLRPLYPQRWECKARWR